MELSAHPYGVQIAASLIAGNTIVIKPAPTTPLSTLRIGALIKDIVPAGVVNFITDENDWGSADCASGRTKNFVHWLDGNRREGDGRCGWLT